MSNYPNANIRHLPPMPLWAAACIIAVAAWFLTTHFLHVSSEAINWDEFALLDRAERSLRLGTVLGSGRPGLVTIALMPFVEGCVDSVRSVVEARLLWQVVTLAYLMGVYCLVRRWFVLAGRPNEGRVQGLLAVTLLAFLPAFVVWSVQVRTDQAALAASVWGGVFLLSRGYRRAVIAGVLFACSILCTQKGIYTIALTGILYATAVADQLLPAGPDARAARKRVLKRIGLAALGGSATLAVYAFFVPSVARLTSPEVLASSLETMRFTRASQGYRIYIVHATRLVVHWALFLVLAAWSIRALWNRERQEIPLLAACWLSLMLGIAVVLVHGSSFQYFIMTAGLFPALALSMALGRPLAMAGRWTWVLVVLAIALAAAQSAHESLEMLYDTQMEQRDTLQLVSGSPLRARRGYQVEGALFCAHDPDPLPTLFSAVIWQRFRQSPQAAQNAASFIEEFRRRPVAYVVESYRLRQFPDPIRSFLADHYVWYGHSLMIAGFGLDLAGEPQNVDVIVEGRYRWQPWNTGDLARVDVDGRQLGPLDEIELSRGPHRIAGLGERTSGRLMLADLPPNNPSGFPGFYLGRQIYQLGGAR